MICRLLVVTALLFTAGSAVAQEHAGSIALGFSLSKPVALGECPLDHCGIVPKTVSGEGEFNVTERVAVVAGGAYSFASLDTSYSGVAIDATANGFTVAGGVRGFTPPGDARAFAQVLAGYSFGSAKATARGFRVTEPFSGWSISPGFGVDVATGEGAALRFSAAVGFGFSGGELSKGIGAGIGLVFGVGGSRAAPLRRVEPDRRNPVRRLGRDRPAPERRSPAPDPLGDFNPTRGLGDQLRHGFVGRPTEHQSCPDEPAGRSGRVPAPSV